MKKPLKIQQMVSLYWRPHRSSDEGGYRVWRGDWIGDCFEVLDEVQFNQLRVVATRFSIRLVKWRDEWDEDNDGVEPVHVTANGKLLTVLPHRRKP